VEQPTWLFPAATCRRVLSAGINPQLVPLGDDGLLALVAPRPAVLIDCGPECKQLVFAHPEDQMGFPVN
jgi:hypothetical protein